ncbi:unnamed protein product [Cladocopium goreaui]|uniref:Transposon protein n=1 Tax=Cladocopium goreaui TaxID=2562237 RepID=A0A9P1CL81_9DINO|nr:unnamed protein product [Cladocopium goreaui]
MIRDTGTIRGRRHVGNPSTPSPSQSSCCAAVLLQSFGAFPSTGSNAQVRDFWSPLSSAKARKQVMRARADVEVGLGIVMLAGALCMYCAPITVILFWNVMMMRYMMSSWTQDSFQRIDNFLNPILMKVHHAETAQGLRSARKVDMACAFL